MRPEAIACCALLALGSGQLAAQSIELDWIDWDRFEAGEVVFKSIKEDQGTVSIELAIRVEADWEAIWSVLRNCDVSPEYVPRVVACSLIEASEDGESELFNQTVKPAFFLPRFDHVFQVDYFPPDRMNVSHVSGPIDRMEGSWRLIDRPDGAIALLHTMTLKPGFPVPRFFVRNTLERDLPKVLLEVRNRAEDTRSD